MGNELKQPFGDGLNRFASGKFQDLQQLLGKGMPASVVSVDDTGTIVTVKIEVQSQLQQFPQITCPVGTSEYGRFPFKAGDKGHVIASDFYLGGMSDLGGGVATLAQMPNLSTLVWYPIGNRNFTVLRDEEKGKPLFNGQQGVFLKSLGNEIELDIDKDKGFTLKLAGVPFITVNSDGIELLFSGFGINITKNGTIIDGKLFLPHEHGGVQSGSNNTGGVA